MNLQEIAFFLLFFTLWIVLNRWVLPWFGIHTCMSGGCAVDRSRTTAAPEVEPRGDQP